MSIAPIQEVNPIGSGDCYLAGLAVALWRQMSAVEALRYAAAAGAANAQQASVATILPADIEALLPRITVDTFHESKYHEEAATDD